MTEILIKIIVTCTLAYVAYEDHKVHELPVLLIFAMLGICSAIRLIWGMPFPVSEALLGLFIAAVPFLAMVFLAKGGFGDVILMSGLGIIAGGRGIVYIILASSLCYLVYGTVMIFRAVKTEKKDVKEGLHMQFPFAPFVLFGWAIYLILCIARIVK